MAPLATHIQYGSIAIEAAWREELVVVVLAVRQAVPLKEVSRADFLLAVGAHKVFWVPRPAHGRHHLHTHTHIQLVSRQGPTLSPPTVSWSPSQCKHSLSVLIKNKLDTFFKVFKDTKSF